MLLLARKQKHPQTKDCKGGFLHISRIDILVLITVVLRVTLNKTLSLLNHSVPSAREEAGRREMLKSEENSEQCNQQR